MCCHGSLSNWLASLKPFADSSFSTCSLLILCNGLIGTFGFLAKLDKHQPAIFGKRFPHGGQHLHRVRELVINIHAQNEIDFALRQFRITTVPNMGLIFVRLASLFCSSSRCSISG